MTEPKLRAGVVGAGNIGRHHVRILAEMADVDLIAIADPAEAAARLATERGAICFETVEAMLAGSDLDLVVVAVPTSMHLAAAGAALQAGCHVLVEKPIASTLEEAHELSQLADDQGRILTVGHVERYNPVVRRLGELTIAGDLGDVSSIVTRRVGGFPPTEPTTDVVVDLAVHDIDILNYLLAGEPRLLSAHGSRTFHTSQIDSVEMLIGYERASGFVQANWVTPMKVRTIDITGTRGFVQANYITQELTWYETEWPDEQLDFPSFVQRLGNPRLHVEKVEVVEPLVSELRAFVDAIRSGRMDELVTPRQATAALALALGAVEEINKDGRG